MRGYDRGKGLFKVVTSLSISEERGRLGSLWLSRRRVAGGERDSHSSQRSEASWRSSKAERKRERGGGEEREGEMGSDRMG